MSDPAADLTRFRSEVRNWLAANFPASLASRSDEYMAAGREPLTGDLLAWRQALASRGWGAPTWPTEYGGGGLDARQARALDEEMAAVGAYNPIVWLAGMGITMVGPTLLEYGTEDQKQRHLPGIASGEIRWCLGYSEPNAGSDLAGLSTRAEDKGDYWLVNGQKTWTSGADISQWCGALVRTDPDAPKRKGISFLMLPMDQPGIHTRPIRLIAGASPFCETFFTDAVADKKDLLGPLNDGWTVGKRLLQHERQSQTGTRQRPRSGLTDSIQELAKRYVSVNDDGTLGDADLRQRLTRNLMDAQAHSLTIERIADEARGNVEVTAAASILKNSATSVAQTRWSGIHRPRDQHGA